MSLTEAQKKKIEEEEKYRAEVRNKIPRITTSTKTPTIHQIDFPDDFLISIEE